MNNALLAYDLLAPMIGGVMLTGVFGFFGGVLLTQRKPKPRAKYSDEERVSGLEAEVIRMHREHDSRQYELDLVRDMLELRMILDRQSDEPITDLEQFASRLGAMVEADRVAVYFVARREGEKVQPVVQCGKKLPDDLMLRWQQVEQSLSQTTIQTESVSVVESGQAIVPSADSPISAAIVAPLHINGRVLGTLCVTRRDSATPLNTHKALVEFGAETLSKILYRVFDEATIRRQARYDHLTDLVNRRSFDAFLNAEIELVRHRESRACSLILADIDHFKSCNDRHGHQVGDLILREVARMLAEQVSHMRLGENSVVARYGGEEFAILLPNVGEAGAVRIAERIRAAVEAKSIEIPSGTLQVTISMGVAECPGHAETAEALISSADRALYRAKNEGRNRVCQGAVVLQ